MEASESNHEALLEHAAWLRRLAIALVGEGAAADDLTQETWTAAMTSGVDTSRPVRPWLRRVATNFANRSFRRRERSSSFAFEEKLDSRALDPAEITERLEHEVQLTSALNSLEEPFRSTLYLRYYEALEPKQIAQRTSTPAGTVRWRLKRGLELVRERLDREVDGGRNTWMAMLIPIAGLPLRATTTVATGVASGSTTLFGALAMSTLFKILLALTASVVLYVSLDRGDLLPPALSTSTPGEVQVEVSFRPIGSESDEQEGHAELASALDPPASDTRPRVSAAKPLKDSPPDLSIFAQVIDEYGDPIKEARVHALSHGIEALSDHNGEVRLKLRPRELATLTISFTKVGRTAVSRTLELGTEREYDMGEVVLSLGGVISGEITGSEGVGIEGAHITWVEGSVPARRLEAQRFGSVTQSFPSCNTNANGEFRLVGVPVGQVRVWAQAADHEPQFTTVLEVRPRFETRGVDITLPKLKPINHVLVRVVDPSGHPVAKALLQYRYSSARLGSTHTGSAVADNEGRYEFLLRADANLSVTASDPHSIFGSSAIEDLRTGPEEIQLALTEARFGELVVTRASNEEVGEFQLELVSPGGHLVHHEMTVLAQAQGRASFKLPASEFVIRVTAPLAELVEIGPLDPNETTSLTARLSELPGLRGTVHASGKAVAGAKVTLHEVAADDIEFSVNGFRSAYHREALGTAQTNERGEFVLTLRTPGEFVVRAETAPYAACDSKPFHIDDDLSGADIKLNMSLGGILEGEVRTGSEASPAETIVGISRGDGHAQTMRVGRDGRYRFTDLTPGLWRVSLRNELVHAGSLSIDIRKGRRIVPYAQLGWDCEVTEGRTTFHSLGLPGMANWSFEGNFSLLGDTSTAWSARLLPFGRFFVEDGPGATALSASGSFTLPVDELGSYQLVLRGDLAVGQEFFLVQPINVETDSPWLFDLEGGQLHLEGVPESQSQQAPALVLLQELPNDGFVLIAIGGNAEAEATIERAPAGACRIARPNPADLNPRNWESVAEIEIPRGGSLTLKLETD